MRMKSAGPRAAAMALVLTTLGALPAAANPIDVLGQIFINNAGGDFPEFEGPILELVYFLEGPGLPLGQGSTLETIPEIGTVGGLQVTRFPTPAPLAPGQAYDLSTHAFFTFGRVLELHPSDRVYDISGEFAFDAGTAILESASFGGLVGFAPFTMLGTLRAFDIDTGAPLFEHELRGQGTAQVTFFPLNPGFFSYAYTLESPPPVPEPATLLLTGTGVLVAATRARRHRRRRAAGEASAALPARPPRPEQRSSVHERTVHR